MLNEALEREVQAKVIELRRKRLVDEYDRRQAAKLTDGEAGDYTAEEKAHLRAIGKNPEILAATRGAATFTEWRTRRDAAAGGIGLKAWTVDINGKRVGGEMQVWAQYVTGHAAALSRLQRAIVNGEVSPERLDRARAGGRAGWKALQSEYGDPTPPPEAA